MREKIKEILWNLRRAVILTTDKEKGIKVKVVKAAFIVSLQPQLEPEQPRKQSDSSRWAPGFEAPLFHVVLSVTDCSCSNDLCDHSQSWGVPGLSAGWFSWDFPGSCSHLCGQLFFDWNCPRILPIPLHPQLSVGVSLLKRIGWRLGYLSRGQIDLKEKNLLIQVTEMSRSISATRSSC